MKKIDKNLIAPCGMDCGLCATYLREKDVCPGCCSPEVKKKTCISCKIKNCKERKGKYCYDCDKFPCDRLKHMDKRYRTKYEMSEIENLEFIKNKGIDDFIRKECKKYQSSKGTFCVHNKKYYK